MENNSAKKIKYFVFKKMPDTKGNISWREKKSNMVKWAGINLLVIPSDRKPTLYFTELHRFSPPSRSELYGLLRRPCYVRLTRMFYPWWLCYLSIKWRYNSKQFSITIVLWVVLVTICLSYVMRFVSKEIKINFTHLIQNLKWSNKSKLKARSKNLKDQNNCL
jgi:hypothetical protein